MGTLDVQARMVRRISRRDGFVIAEISVANNSSSDRYVRVIAIADGTTAVRETTVPGKGFVSVQICLDELCPKTSGGMSVPEELLVAVYERSGTPFYRKRWEPRREGVVLLDGPAVSEPPRKRPVSPRPEREGRKKPEEPPRKSVPRVPVTPRKEPGTHDDNGPGNGRKKAPSPAGFIEADFGPVREAYFHDLNPDDNTISLGVLSVCNRSDTEARFRMVVMLRDRPAINKVYRLQAQERDSIPVRVPVFDLFREEYCMADVDVEIYDGGNTQVFCSTNQIPVLSMYDTKIIDIGKNAARMVNPHLDFIERIVCPKGSRMDDILGYPSTTWSSTETYRCVEALLISIADLGIEYMSDTSSGNPYMQKVRPPDKVYRERSGNCIDMSVFVASFLERLSIDPVVIRLSRHAMVGVILDTDFYDFEKIDDKDLEAYAVTLKSGDDRFLKVAFIEATVISHPFSFRECLRIGRRNVMREVKTIDVLRDCAIVMKKRREGQRPITAPR